MTEKRKDKIRLGLFYWPGGNHVAGWRHPRAEDDGTFNFKTVAKIAQTAERGLFDLFFLADIVGLRPDQIEAQSMAARSSYLEPLTLLSALAAVTDRIGLVATATTTYNEPYHLARKFASIDLISGGRAGWNLVTSHNQAEAANFSSHAHMAHADRYARAREFAEVVKGLWNSWDDDALLRDKESGRYFDPDKVHFLNHEGELFKVRGPLNVSRSRQGHPVIVQAGSSGPGRDLAAETAEVVFTAAENFEQGRAFYADTKARLPRFGRAESHMAIMPGLYPVIGGTEAEAKAKLAELQEMVNPATGLFLLQHLLGRDLSMYPLDEPLPDLPAHDGAQGRTEVILRTAREKNLTLRQLYQEVAVARGHNMICGTPEQVADEMEKWFLGGAADGFNLLPPCFPWGLDDFVDHVVPVLQRRGLYRTEYEGETLRENLGLPYPEVSHAKPAKSA